MSFAARLKRFYVHGRHLKPEYRSWSNVIGGGGVILGLAPWYFVLAPSIPTILGMHTDGYARPGDPTALVAVTLIGSLTACTLLGIVLVAYMVVLAGKLPRAEIDAVLWKLEYPSHWTITGKLSDSNGDAKA